MRAPPLKAIEAVKINRVDSRTRHIAVRFRGYFICMDKDGKETSNEGEIARIRLTPRAEGYWTANSGKSRIPA